LVNVRIIVTLLAVDIAELADLPELSSPALVVDLGRFDANVAAADEWFSGSGKKIRPHVKTHRTPGLALRQLTPNAAGLTCATVGEAEAMVQAGARDILIANEVVERGKLDRVAALATQAQVCVAVDSADAAAALDASAQAVGSTVAVLVDVDVGLGRCGTDSPAAATKLGAKVESMPGLRLAGLMGYEGRRRPSDPDRARVVERAYVILAEAKQSFDRAGLPSGTVSAAGTSTLREALADPTITEIQAGTYALMERDLDGLGLPFEPAVSIVATVISRAPRHAVLDAGRKSIASDYGPPQPLVDGAEVAAFNEEHTTLRFDRAAGPAPALGQRMLLRPKHVRLTFNLHDVVWLAHQDGSVEKIPVSARGRSW
jgi:D-serine deaminase-like pyridoxal phosphate-dependent protein